MDRGAHDDFLRLACLGYGPSDHPERRARAAELLATHPGLPTWSVPAAAAAGDPRALGALLDEQPAAVSSAGGPQAWAPLLFACYSRLERQDSRCDTFACARILLERGADPNSHFLWGGIYRFTALTGAFGEGEAGPVNQPPHPRWRELAALLLAEGADPNDSQALYNRMFRPGSDCLRMLLEAGLDGRARNNWLVHDERGALVPHPEPTLAFQLRWAAEHDHLDRVELLAAQGFDLLAPDRGGRTAWRHAARTGSMRVRRFLEQHGAVPEELGDEERARGALLAGDREALASVDPPVVRRLLAAEPRLPREAAERDRAEAVALLLDLGAEPGTALHAAAWKGHLDIVQLLVKRGASLELRDETHDSTPLGHARHGGDRPTIDWLLSVGAPD